LLCDAGIILSHNDSPMCALPGSGSGMQQTGVCRNCTRAGKAVVCPGKQQLFNKQSKHSVMSETSKNSLFRFVTLRSPELINEKDKKTYYVYHPDPKGQGQFKTAIANPAATEAAQLQQLKSLAAAFNSLKTTDELKTLVGENTLLYAAWLAKNGSVVFAKTAAAYTASPVPAALSNAVEVTVWDNLFYELVQNSNPQLRQLYIEVLIANAYLKAAGKVYQHQLAKSRVVLPVTFFGKGTQQASPPAAAAATPAPVMVTSGLMKANSMAAANQKIKEYEALAKELHAAEKQYIKANETAYKEARRQYEKSVNDTGGALPSAKASSDAAADLFAAPDTLPDSNAPLPAFEFTPLPEVDTTRAYLPQAAAALVSELQPGQDATLNELRSQINNAIGSQAAIIAGLHDGDISQVVVVNNMLLPVNNMVQPQQYSYFIELFPVLGQPGRYKMYCSIFMGSNTSTASKAIYHAVFTSGTNTNGAFVQTPYGSYLTLEFYTSAGEGSLLVPAGQTGFRFHGSITLTDGVVLNFDTPVTIAAGASGVMTVSGAQSGGGGTIEVAPGYGIKRLGVADYRKVEQSVCCYEPGEVSHIENIMAREYKERSSRRLSRSEDTTVFERQLEKETQKDTSTTERFELQKEVQSVVSKDTSFDSHVGLSKDFGGFKIDANANFATNTSKEDSNRNAVNYAKEVTESALERVVQKVREERTIKIIEEYEEQNKHGFDNREGDKHVSGVYRWIDKVYKNQVYNYGKRLMYEFMVPQPATFHNQAVKLLAQAPSTQVLQIPADPRTSGGYLQMSDFRSVNALTFPYWSARYQADVNAMPDEVITVSGAYSMGGAETGGTDISSGASAFKLQIPEGYEATSAKVQASTFFNKRNYWVSISVNVAGSSGWSGAEAGGIGYTCNLLSNPIRKELAVSIGGRNLGGAAVNVVATCRRTAEAYEKWQVESFNAIIAAYNEKLDEYNKAVAATQQPVVTGTKEINPGFYRQIENTVLRKNCISYLVSDSNMGKKFYKGTTVADTLPVVDADMENYAAMVKFIEQAFEWELMSYRFYPFYWANRADWQSLYQQEVNDQLFRSFLQSGMARTVVSVRPGFEEAVMYFMTTGKIWNGGQVPAIGDDLYLSIVEELKNPEFYVDETWETRVPTTLTVIQSGSIGLDAQGLPCACGHETGITNNDAALAGGAADGDFN
jgi:hypothetical protein